jgi:hypothetical protein
MRILMSVQVLNFMNVRLDPMCLYGSCYTDQNFCAVNLLAGKPYLKYVSERVFISECRKF